MTRERWRSADREAELCAAERDIESVGLGPATVREIVNGGVAIIDAHGRTHAVLGWELHAWSQRRRAA